MSRFCFAGETKIIVFTNGKISDKIHFTYGSQELEIIVRGPTSLASLNNVHVVLKYSAKNSDVSLIQTGKRLNFTIFHVAKPESGA